MEIEFEPSFRLTIYSHFFKISHIRPGMISPILQFCSKNAQMGFVKKKGFSKPSYQVIKVYAARVSDSSEFRFHIGQLADFQKHMSFKGTDDSLYQIRKMDAYPPKVINTPLKDGWTLYDYQEEAIDFILQEDPSDNHSRLVALGTGLGKTVLSLAAISRLKQRCLIYVLSTYIDKWAKDIVNTLKIKPSDIMIVRGTPAFQGLIDLANRDKLESKFILISIETNAVFYKTYELDPQSQDTKAYGCHPENVCKLLKVGTVLIDETHQHFHRIFKILLYTHVPKVIALSATLISDDPFISKMQQLVFPKDIRFLNVQLRKYIKAYAMAYVFDDFQHANIRTTEYGTNLYSHIAFERSIARNPIALSGYLSLIDDMLQLAYFDEYIDGDKAAIYCSSVAMSNHIVQYLKQRYRDYDVRRYCEGDPYENIIEPDIRVTTIISGGTAIDIPDLRALILTINLKSPASNLQTMGRLRDLKTRDVKFYWMYCEQILKHREYHQLKKELIQDRVLSLKEYRISKPVATKKVKHYH